LPASSTRGVFQKLKSAERDHSPARVEVLVPDFQGAYASVETVVRSPIDIYNHNLETVPSLYRTLRPGGNYDRSLEVIGHARNPPLTES